MPPFTLLSLHGHVLAHAAAHGETRTGDIAAALGTSEAGVQRAVADLIDAGLLVRRATGRHATVAPARPRIAALMQEASAFERPAGAGANPKRDEIREKLRDAVERFLNDGRPYAALSVAQLVQAVGISRSTFYANFRDKQDLLRALAEDLVAELGDAARFWTDLGPGLNRADLHDAMVRIVAAQRPHRGLMAAAAAADPAEGTVRAAYHAAIAETIAAISAHLHRGQAEGFVRAGLDVEPTAQMLAWGAELRLSRLPDGEEADGAVQALTDILWNLLYADA